MFKAEGELEETAERQMEEIEDQMRAWSRVIFLRVLYIFKSSTPGTDNSGSFKVPFRHLGS